MDHHTGALSLAVEDTMPKQIKLYAYAALVTFAIVQPSHAQMLEQAYDIAVSPAIAAAKPSDEASGITYPVSAAAEFRPNATRSMEALLTEIATWLSTDFGLPAIEDRPRVEFASPMKLMAMRYNGMLPNQWREDSMRDPAMQAAQAREVVAVYHDKTRTIFLPDAWTGTTPAELSVLVHEMVHHLQNLAGLAYVCPAAREKPAYLAQDQWLKLHGLDLETEFEIDKFTLLVSSACLR
jgi:hypothetical protein